MIPGFSHTHWLRLHLAALPLGRQLTPARPKNRRLVGKCSDQGTRPHLLLHPSHPFEKTKRSKAACWALAGFFRTHVQLGQGEVASWDCLCLPSGWSHTSGILLEQVLSFSLDILVHLLCVHLPHLCPEILALREPTWTLSLQAMFSTQALPKRYHCSLPTWLIPMIIGTTPWNIASRQLAATQPPAPWLIGTPKWG